MHQIDDCMKDKLEVLDDNVAKDYFEENKEYVANQDAIYQIMQE